MQTRRAFDLGRWYDWLERMLGTDKTNCGFQAGGYSELTFVFADVEYEVPTAKDHSNTCGIGKVNDCGY
jgi:hypothetical protein